MRVLFADTANLDEIKEAMSMGVIRGVTTNPSLISKEPKQNFDGLIKDLARFCSDNQLSFSVEVFATEPDEMIKQAIKLVDELSIVSSTLDLHIKIPIGVEEIKVIKTLSDKGIKVNCTCCFTAAQMQAAALAGAKYVSIFYNRARDMKVDVNSAIMETSAFVINNSLDCEIIAGSIRKSQDVTEAWAAGADIVTCSFKTIKEMLQHEGTTKSIDGFMKDFSNWLNND